MPTSSSPESASAEALDALRVMAQTLDELGIAMCLFEDGDEDRTLLWNHSFLKLFPEHAGAVHEGEPYRANLERFYRSRLGEADLPMLDRFVAEGLARHRTQQRPFAFKHRGVRLSVSSLPLPGIGRVRVWKPETAIADPLEQREVEFGASASDPALDGGALFDNVADGVVVSGPDGLIHWVNEPFVRMYGLPDRDAPIGIGLEQTYRHAWRDRGPDDADIFEAGLATLRDCVQFSGAPFELPLPGQRWSRVVEQRAQDGRGFAAHVDISMLKRQQVQLQMAERRARESERELMQKSALLEATMERMEQGILMVNAERVVEVCNRRAIELLGLPPSLMAARPTFGEVLAYQWATDEFAHTPQDVLDFVRAGGILDQPHSYERQRPDGRTIEVQSVPIAGGGLVRTYTDITERRRAEERIRHSARHDGLTSLVNREVFLEYLATATAVPDRSGAVFAVHYIDIDRFKPINDRHGHAVGDKVIALIAQRMRAVAEPSDVVGRMGGDEFAVLQWGVGGAEDAVALAQRMLESVREPMEVEGHHLQVGASVGVALFPAGGQDADSLLRNADSAMYVAKANGAVGVRVFGDTAWVSAAA
ncbi:MAG: diguanylate cyclase [Comamonadaceae bacterium]|nr:MAG: diguanylate cyclase [Comamonadaceae bacterium]